MNNNQENNKRGTALWRPFLIIPVLFFLLLKPCIAISNTRANNAIIHDSSSKHTLFSEYLNQKKIHQYPQAKATILDLLEQDPGNPDYHYEYALLLAIIEPDNPSAIDSLQKAIDTIPNRNDYIVALAEAQFRFSQYDDAIKTYKTLMKHQPDNDEILYRIAAIMAVQHNFQDAIQYFDVILTRNPNHADALTQKARILSLQGKEKDAEPLLQKALKITPRHFTALVEMGKIQKRKKQWPEANEYFLKALDVYPFMPEVYSLLAQISFAQNNPAKAKEYMNLVNSLLENTEQFLSFLDSLLQNGAVTFDENYMLGMKLTQLKQYQLALSFLETAFRLEPKSQKILIPLTSLYLELNDYGKAYETIDRLTDPNMRFSGEGLSAMGWAAFHTKQYSIVEGVLAAAQSNHIQTDRLDALAALFNQEQKRQFYMQNILITALFLLLIFFLGYRLKSLHKR